MTPQPKSNRESVLNAINILCEHRDAATRQQIVAMTGIKMGIVDEHVKNLRLSDQVRMLSPGFYAPVDQEPDRPVSATVLPRGRLKIELGDQVMDVNPREGFALAKLLAGLLLAFRVGA